MKKSNPALKPLSRRLRKEMTPEERKLWFLFLRDYPIRFYRQRVIGDYIADFYCAAAKLVVELDGAQHAEPEAALYDERRRAEMEKLGIATLRISNRDVNDRFSDVCAWVTHTIKERGITDFGKFSDM
ncbi:MAG: DUF559 domain-containing protein [Clostridia bacterium]|nr:DUF559 domain-containing protein [Clostridia bacterium]